MKNFIDTPNMESGLFKRKILPIPQMYKTVEIGVWPVVFGFRIRIGMYDHTQENHCRVYALDLCCGNNASMVSLVYTCSVAIILSNLSLIEKGKYLEMCFPAFTRRPINRDPNFDLFLQKAIGFMGHNTVIVTVEELLGFRTEQSKRIKQTN